MHAPVPLLSGVKTILWAALLAGFLVTASSAPTKGEQSPRALVTFAVSEGYNAPRGLCFSLPGAKKATRLTGPKQPDSDPAWSPDGKLLAFSRGTRFRSRIYVANARGRVLGALPAGSRENFSPTWSPDGHRIAYVSRVPNASGIDIVDSRTGAFVGGISGPTWSYADSPSWSPDGDRLAFQMETTETGGRWAIYTARLDNSDQRLLVNDGSFPAWSPDGKKLAYFSSASGVFSLVVANADGTHPHTVPRKVNRNLSVAPEWSPDSTRIAYTTGVGRSPTSTWISIVRADSGKLVGIIKRRGSLLSSPAWRSPAKMPSPGRGAC